MPRRPPPPLLSPPRPLPLPLPLPLLLLLLPLLLGSSSGWAAALGLSVPLQAFELRDVTLASGTFQSRAAASNTQYLLQLDPDRMLWAFRNNAKLPTPGVPFYGTWEDPGCELRGHFVGHYLTALALLVSSTGNATVRSRLELYIDELHKVQVSLDQAGYLSAFPSEHLDRVEALQPVWAPYYVIHKIMAGLLDSHLMAGSDKALVMVQDMAAYFLRRIEAVVLKQGEAHWQRCLETEFGGMNDVMYRLYGLTKEPSHLRLASLFDKRSFLEPMVAGRDVLGGHHANTHLAQIVGFAERSESTGDGEASAAVRNFFAMVSEQHSYASAGSNMKEFWFAAGQLGEAIVNKEDSLETQEICTQYNILKIARSLFRWSGDVKLADFYERALVNGILGVSRLTNDDVYVETEHHHGHGHQQGQEPSGGAEEQEEQEGQGHHHQEHQHHHHHRELWELSGNPRHSFRSGGGQATALPAHDPREPVPSGSSALGVGVGVALHRRPFETRFQDYWGMNLAKMPNSANASNAPGTPGVFLYLLPMGSGQSKGDNFHHWGYPMHSFWCCYGTAIESFAKLADSIYFHSPAQQDSPPKLYINQLVSSSLHWREQAVTINMTASMYEQGPSASATLTVRCSPGPVRFTLLLRIPQWSDPRRTWVRVNGGEQWRRCPNFPSPASYCSIARIWSSGDVVELSLGLTYWFKALPDTREEYQGLKALMMGPYVMAGLTHDTRWLHLPDQSPDALSQLMSEPGDPEELVSLQAAWNSSLYLRHDLYHAHMSVMEDNGDAGDATFRLVRGCQAPSPLTSSSSSTGSRTSSLTKAAGAEQASLQHHMQHQMLVGLHDDHAVMLEAFNMPGFHLGVEEQERQGAEEEAFRPLTLTQPGALGGDSQAGQGQGMGAAGAASSRSCHGHQFMVRPGLDGVEGTVSLESVAYPGSFVSAAAASPPPGQDPGPRFGPGSGSGSGSGSFSVPCADDVDSKLDCAAKAKKGWCLLQPDIYKVRCRKSCGTCSSLSTALTLRRMSGSKPDPSLAATASFRMAQPLAHLYPPGSKVITGSNRRYLVAPLGNIVDERYTVYFNLQSFS